MLIIGTKKNCKIRNEGGEGVTYVNIRMLRIIICMFVYSNINNCEIDFVC